MICPKQSIIFFLFTLVSCGEHQESNHVSINLESPHTENLNDVFSEFGIIPLELHPEAQLVEIDKLLVTDSHYFVLDRSSAVIFVFDKKGEFSNKLDAFGEGPGEYLAISDFNINPFNGNLEVLSPDGVLIVYDSDFTFLDEFSLEGLSSFQYFNYLNEDLIALNTLDHRNPAPVILWSRIQRKLFKEVYLPLHELEKHHLVFMEDIFFRSANSLFICTRFANEVYQITEDSLLLKKQFDFGKYNFPTDQIKADEAEKYYHDFFSEQIQSAFGSIKKYNESDRSVVFQFSLEGKTRFFVQEKASGKYQILDRYFTFDEFKSDTEEIYAVISPEAIPNYDFWPEWDSGQRNLLEEAKENEQTLLLRLKID
ncbi:6-bladed beta-propeller [Algoriphagus hitonicola]|uniref:6-bladed beta-propeller protein n=1 Tax=Algoriphagus hitonicola TaxID=435880 RepID=A0A1I2XNB6_9BACT|nr:6-bladed beta-propeller [Algoriphagus hitonicola]SFH14882.1 hypothetical protein SAMN04487988_1214 [Algoriphagus hitonicola]